jgi:hypothetical protein
VKKFVVLVFAIAGLAFLSEPTARAGVSFAFGFPIPIPSTPGRACGINRVAQASESGPQNRRKGFEDPEQLWQQFAPGGYNVGIR